MKKIILILLISCVFSLAAQESVNAQTTKYTNGQHYTEIKPAYDTDNKEQVVVYEFFGYKCPHCASFQPFINPWHKKLPKHIKLIRVPVVFQSGWDILAKAYYTAETMGISEKSHQAMFDAIHKQRKKFRNIEDIAKWYADNFNLDEKEFLSTANSFMIDSKIRHSNNLMKKMQIGSTPTLVINGKYKPDIKKLGSHNAVLDVATYFSNKEAVAMGLIK